MPASEHYAVALQRAGPRTIAAVRARVPIARISSVFGGHLDRVYAAARMGAIALDGQNIFVYRDAPDHPGEVDVAFGVGLAAPCGPVEGIEPTALPIGDVATTTHWGAYEGLGAAHEAVITWCRTHGHRLAGPRWEVYGHVTSDDSRRRTDVYYLLAP